MYEETHTNRCKGTIASMIQRFISLVHDVVQLARWLCFEKSVAFPGFFIALFCPLLSCHFHPHGWRQLLSSSLSAEREKRQCWERTFSFIDDLEIVHSIHTRSYAYVCWFKPGLRAVLMYNIGYKMVVRWSGAK